MHREVIWRRLKGLVGWIRDFKAGYRLHMMVHMLLFLGKTDANFGYHWNLGSGRAVCFKISVKVDNSGLPQIFRMKRFYSAEFLLHCEAFSAQT